MSSNRLVRPARQILGGLRSGIDAPRGSSARGLATVSQELPVQSTNKPLTTTISAAAAASSFGGDSRLSDSDSIIAHQKSSNERHIPPRNPFLSDVYCTAYSFPSMEPCKLLKYPSTHLALPLRRDILHRAVIYEADSTRAGTASTKWRNEIHGSGRKLRPQKGTGKARLGDRGSPMLRGGGVAFGPKPRDFSTELPRKIYDLAFRTALSHRYRSGELTIVDGPVDIDVHPATAPRYLKDLLTHNGMGRVGGRTIFVTSQIRPGLFSAFSDDALSREGRIREVEDVDVKNLLEMGRLVIERDALDWLLRRHEADVHVQSKLMAWRKEQDLEETS